MRLKGKTDKRELKIIDKKASGGSPSLVIDWYQEQPNMLGCTEQESGLLHLANFSWTLIHRQESAVEREPWRSTSVIFRGKEVDVTFLQRWPNFSHQVYPWDYLDIHYFKINPNFPCNSVSCYIHHVWKSELIELERAGHVHSQDQRENEWIIPIGLSAGPQLNYFSHRSFGMPCLRNISTHSGLGLPLSTNTDSSSSILSSQKILVWVKLTLKLTITILLFFNFH